VAVAGVVEVGAVVAGVVDAGVLVAGVVDVAPAEGAVAPPVEVAAWAGVA